MKRETAYVKQEDLFFPHLTVRDTLTYTALLRLPRTWDRKKKDAEVAAVIERLRLNRCADTPIMLISGGEKKRTNIGTELLTSPRIILLVRFMKPIDPFVRTSRYSLPLSHFPPELNHCFHNNAIAPKDEPTSGLDSTSAVALIRTLQTLASENRTVVTSIHQPSSAVFAS